MEVTMLEETSEGRRGPKWLLLIQGILLILLSLLAFTAPGATLQFLVVLLGVYWLVSGVLHLFWLVFDRSSWGIKLLLGIVGIIAGLLIIQHPLASTILVPATLVIVMGWIGVLMGVFALIHAFTGGGWGAAVLGVLSIIFGILILTNIIFTAQALPFIIGGIAALGGILSLIGFWSKS
jgi:uncharacterized membrane protein HdeD (DUF308 family)